jgi:hypothetical protein
MNLFKTLNEIKTNTSRNDQWDQIYPNREIFQEDINNHSLYIDVLKKSKEIIGCFGAKLSKPTILINNATYIVNDQFGADITNSYLANNIQFTSNVGTITARQGLIQLSFFPNINPLSLTKVTITGVDLNSGVTTTATLTL